MIKYVTYHYNSHDSTQTGQEPSTHSERDYAIHDGLGLGPRCSMIAQWLTEQAGKRDSDRWVTQGTENIC